MPGHDHSLRKLYSIEGLKKPWNGLQLDLSSVTQRRLPVRGSGMGIQ